MEEVKEIYVLLNAQQAAANLYQNSDLEPYSYEPNPDPFIMNLSGFKSTVLGGDPNDPHVWVALQVGQIGDKVQVEVVFSYVSVTLDHRGIEHYAEREEVYHVTGAVVQGVLYASQADVVYRGGHVVSEDLFDEEGPAYIPTAA